MALQGDDQVARLGVPDVGGPVVPGRQDLSAVGAEHGSRDLGIDAAGEGGYARELTEDVWPGREDRGVATRGMLDEGVRVTLGSDAPVAPLDDVVWRHDEGTVATADRNFGRVGTTWEIRGTGDFDRDEAIAFSHLLAAVGVDIVDVSTGQVTPDEQPAFGRSYQTPFSDSIRNKTGIATVAVGVISRAR